MNLISVGAPVQCYSFFLLRFDNVAGNLIDFCSLCVCNSRLKSELLGFLIEFREKFDLGLRGNEGKLDFRVVAPKEPWGSA